MKSKKAQQDIIVTVLLVLIALAAVALIAAFIVRSVITGTSSASDRADCIKAVFTVTKVTNQTGAIGLAVSVRREAGSDDVKISSLKILVAGASGNVSGSIPNALETSVVNVTDKNYTSGAKVEVAPVLQDGTICAVITSYTLP